MVYSSSAVAAFTVICVLIIVIVLLGNIFIIDAVRRHKRMRTIPNICITSLAVADLLVGLISIPMYIYSLFHYTEITITYQKFQGGFDIYFGITSILHLVFISMERCYAITFPMQRRMLTKGTMFKILMVLWITAGIPVVLYITEVAYAMAIVTGLFFLVPLLIVIISYTILTVTVKTASKRTRRFSTRSPASKKEVRLAKTLSIVVLFFAIAWLPYFFVLISLQYPKFIQIKLTQKGWYYLVFFVKCLHFSNSGVNPFIYAFRQQEYANAFKHLCFGSRFPNRGQFQASSTRSSLIPGSILRRESQGEESRNNKKENSKKGFCRPHGDESNNNSDKLESHV